jgi:hypothetical protein
MNQTARPSKSPDSMQRKEGEGRGGLVAVDPGREVDPRPGPAVRFVSATSGQPPAMLPKVSHLNPALAPAPGSARRGRRGRRVRL